MASAELSAESKDILRAIAWYLSSRPSGAKAAQIVAGLKADEDFQALGHPQPNKRRVNSLIYHHGGDYDLTMRTMSPPLWVYTGPPIFKINRKKEESTAVSDEAEEEKKEDDNGGLVESGASGGGFHQVELTEQIK